MNYLSDFSVKCNVLLIGKTGTGKSTFANYLFGVDKFTIGTGAPVTKWEENFQKYDLNVSDVQINVYDSVGLVSRHYCKSG
jgi:predicted GTPase